ncbi:hypothetical protein FOL47_009960, partial [Perkinsus chesapeaki]
EALMKTCGMPLPSTTVYQCLYHGAVGVDDYPNWPKSVYKTFQGNSVRRAAIDTRHSHKDVTTPPERVAEVIHINESDFEGKIHLGPVDGESMDVSHGKGSSVRVIPITIFCIVTLSIVGIITRLVIVTRRINSKLAKASKIEDYDGNSMIEAKSENADDFVDEPDANSESTSAASEGTPSPLPTTPTHVNDD